MVLSKDVKIAICFGLIMGAIISIFNMCFAVETETLTATTVQSLNMNSSNDHFTSGSQTIAYYPIEKGYRYTIYNDSTSVNLLCAFSNEVPAVDVSYFNLFQLNKNGSYSFVSNHVGYLYVDIQHNSKISVTREPVEGMNGFVQDISMYLSVNNLSSVLNFVVPILAISVLLGLGFYLIKRLLNRIKRTKGGI